MKLLTILNMAYSRTPKTIARVSSLLDEMVECDIDLEWSVENPRKLAYDIWQAIMYAIKSGKLEYMKYTILGSKYRIGVTSDTVTAKLKSHAVVNGTIIRDINDVLEVIGCAVGLKLKNMIFPDIGPLNSSDTNILFNWCRGNDYQFRWNTKNQLQLIRYDG